MEQFGEEQLRSLAQGPRGTGGRECPSPQDWVNLAGGIATEADGQWLLTHAAGCDACGETLTKAVEAMSSESNEEDARLIASLESARPQWQRRMASRMCEAGMSARRPVPVWRWAAIAAALVVTAGVTTWTIAQRKTPGQLLARAYTAKRAFEFRLPDAGYAPVRAERQATSTFDRPPDLLEAEAIIGRELSRHADDASWLAWKGRAEMLTSNYETAIQSFERALDARPGDPQLLSDLACAKALRGDAEKRAVDYAAAAELFSQSLEKRPDTPAVLFNRALVYERLFLYDEALKDWKRYLTLDGSGSWADEARTRMAGIEQKKK